MRIDNAQSLDQMADLSIESDSKCGSLSTIKIIAAIVTIVLALAAGGWGTYAFIQQRQAQASSPEGLISQCRDSIRRIEQNLSKHVA